MNDKTILILSLSAIVCVSIICGTILILNNSSNQNQSITNETDTMNVTNDTVNNTENNNTTSNSNEKQSTSSYKSSKKSSSTSNSEKSSSYRPDVDSSGITREQADYFGYTYTPEHGGHYIGSHEYWDPEAGMYHD